MSKTQTPKHEFPKDWSNITDKEAIERINHLLKHYKEYDIKKQGDSITIDGVLIAQVDKRFLGKCFAIGYPMGIYWQDSPVYQLIEWLYNLCKTEAEKREQQAKTEAEKREQQAKIKAEKQRKIEKIVTIAGISAIIILVVAGAYEIAKQVKMNKQEQAKQIKIENEVKRYEQTLPNYKEYEQVKVKSQNYRDSLNKVYQ